MIFGCIPWSAWDSHSYFDEVCKNQTMYNLQNTDLCTPDGSAQIPPVIILLEIFMLALVVTNFICVLFGCHATTSVRYSLLPFTIAITLSGISAASAIVAFSLYITSGLAKEAINTGIYLPLRIEGSQNEYVMTKIGNMNLGPSFTCAVVTFLCSLMSTILFGYGMKFGKVLTKSKTILKIRQSARGPETHELQRLKEEELEYPEVTVEGKG